VENKKPLIIMIFRHFASSFLSGENASGDAQSPLLHSAPIEGEWSEVGDRLETGDKRQLETGEGRRLRSGRGRRGGPDNWEGCCMPSVPKRVAA
jgi:hypothetical protein